MKDLNLKDFELPAHVEQAPKRTQYTIVPIADIAVYRAERKAFEEEWQHSFLKREAERRMSAHNGVAEQNLQITLTEAEQAEVRYRQERQDRDDKLPTGAALHFNILDTFNSSARRQSIEKRAIRLREIKVKLQDSILAPFHTSKIEKLEARLDELDEAQKQSAFRHDIYKMKKIDPIKKKSLAEKLEQMAITLISGAFEK